MQGRFLAHSLSVLLVLTGLLPALDTSAMWARLSDEELIEASSVVVKAEMTGITTVRFAGTGKNLRLGVLQVEKTYKGSRQTVRLLALPPEAPVSSTDIVYVPGQSGIWFLRESNTDTGIYMADNPQRFWPSEQEAKLQLLLDTP